MVFGFQQSSSQLIYNVNIRQVQCHATVLIFYRPSCKVHQKGNPRQPLHSKQQPGLLFAMLSVLLAIALTVMAVIEGCLTMPSSGTAVSLSFLILTFARLGHLKMKAKHF